MAWRTMEGLGVAGLVLAALALFKPRAVGPLFVALSLVTFPIGLVVGEITLLLMYWLVFVPVGVIFRLVGRDALNRRSGKHAATYWKAKHTTGTIERYFHQY